MADIWDLWQEQGEFWRRLFSSIDPAIETFVREQARENRKVEVIPHRWDEPSRLLVFQSPIGLGIWNNIELLVVGQSIDPRLRFSCAAWRDEDLPSPTPIRRRRFWCHSSQDMQDSWNVLPTRKQTDDPLETLLLARLSAVFGVVGSWRLLESGLWQGEGIAAESPTVVP